MNLCVIGDTIQAFDDFATSAFHLRQDGCATVKITRTELGNRITPILVNQLMRTIQLTETIHFREEFLAGAFVVPVAEAAGGMAGKIIGILA